MSELVLLIDLTSPAVPVVEAGQHVHLCPECFLYVGCEYDCSCFEDLMRSDGTPCGSPAMCAFCAHDGGENEK